MKDPKMRKWLLLTFLILNTSFNFAHPTGDMVYVNNTLLWSYIYPVGDIQHKACVMIWDEENGARPWLSSHYSASDWMISQAGGNSVYLVERYYNQGEDSHFSRLLAAEVGKEPVELMSWFKDDHRFGEHGFAVIDDTTTFFAHYPNLYKFNEDQSAERVEQWKLPVNSIRNTSDGNILILSDSTIWLTDRDLNILKSWNGLLEPLGSDQPFGGNRISDADFSGGSLYLSYWGKRRFDMIENDKRETVLSFSSPWIPHHIAKGGSKLFMLSSTIAPEATNNIEPSLWLIENGKFELIWGDSGTVTDVKIDMGHIDYKLFQNYSNPFNPKTQISYSIPKKSHVKLDVYSINGERTRSLVNRVQDTGVYNIEFDGSNLSSGIYIYKIQAGTYAEAKKMILLK